MTALLRVALIGAGGWGSQHARNLARRADVDFCAAVGRDPERTSRFASSWGVRAYVDIAEMLDKERPDLVIQSLPNLEHFAPTLQVIEAGIPLIVEKPLVFSLAEADQLLEAAAKRHLFFAIVFNHRYARPVQLAKQAVDSNQLGDITFALWRFGGNWQTDHPHMTLIESQCHGFDMLEHLCGPIASVSCELTDKTGHGFRSLAIALGFANGAVGTMVGGYDSSFAYHQTHLLEINGTAGRILVEDTVRRYTFQALGETTRTVWEAGYKDDHDRSFHATLGTYLDAALDAFKQGAAPPVPASCGRRALQLALASVQSFQTGTRVKV